MPTLKIPDAQIEAAKSPRGGFTRKTLAAWGVLWPPVKGWRRALIEGRPIPERRRRRSRSNGRKQSTRGAVTIGDRTTAKARKGATMIVTFQPNDRVQAIANRKLGTCRGFDDNGRIVVEWDDGQTESYPPGNLGWFQKADSFLDDFLP